MYPPLNPGGEGDQKKAQLVFRESKYFQETESQKKKAQAAQLVYCESDFQETNRQGEPKEHKEHSNIHGVQENETTRYNENRNTTRYNEIQRQEMCDGMEALAWKDDGAALCTVTRP
jgi:hypothetical protein